VKVYAQICKEEKVRFVADKVLIVTWFEANQKQLILEAEFR